MKPLKGRVAVVAGATRGAGRGVARMLGEAAGGRGIPVRVDHTAEAEVAALFKRVRRERRALDVLVNILTGPPVAEWRPFWKLTLEKGRAMLDGWLWPHITTCWHALPLMVQRESGL